jgi:hypothetical protein
LAVGRRHTRWIMHLLHVWSGHIWWTRRGHPRHHGLDQVSDSLLKGTEYSKKNKLVQDNRKDMVYRHSHGLPPGLPRTREAAWVAGQEVPCGEIAVADCVGAEGTIVYSACRYMATRPL